MPLEALIAGESGFNDLPAADVAALDYWRLRGSVPPGEVIQVGKEAAQLAEEARDGLLALIRLFDRNDTPYEARPRPDKAPDFPITNIWRVSENGRSPGREREPDF